MTIDPPKTASNSQRAAIALRELIFSGELWPGSNHLETELADRLDMSRTPVREALLVLEGQGLLKVVPRRGVRILPVSPDDMREIYDVLTAIEALAARKAAEAGYSGDDLSELVKAIDNMDAAIAREDREAWAVADEAFHRELVRLANNTRVMDIFDRMSDQVRRAKAVTLHVRPLPVQSNADHRAVYEAIRAGDVEQAGKRHEQHRLRAKEVLVGLLEQLGLTRL
ncbi:MAG: GntR family transcriptional regulator [Pseudomonadota bacterium]